MRNTMASHHAESNRRMDRMELKIKRIAMLPAARMRSEPGSTSGRRAHDYNRYSKKNFNHIYTIPCYLLYLLYFQAQHFTMTTTTMRRQRWQTHQALLCVGAFLLFNKNVINVCLDWQLNNYIVQPRIFFHSKDGGLGT